MKLRMGVLLLYDGVYNLSFIGGVGHKTHILFFSNTEINYQHICDINEKNLRVVFMKRMVRFLCGK